MGFFGNDNKGFFDRLKNGLSKTRKFLLKNVDEVILGEKKISPELFEELEEVLIAADVGPAFTYELIERMKDEVTRKDLSRADLLRQVLKDTMADILKKSEAPLLIPKDKLFVMMVIGVNGTGKTTTVGKLALRFKNKGIPVMIVAADTFRAAAIEQLEVWGKRADVPTIKQQMKSDPSAVVFDAIHAAQAGKADVVIIDTAGRLHTKANLMEELKKMKRILSREQPGAPHEVLLVLDATTGQNALIQAEMFAEEIGVTGLALTKLDGTSKGGVIIRIAHELKLPIRYIGIGEGIDDLRRFNSEEFIDALFERSA
ncbi:MAG: signal recognition particle-docking protein FtsY [Deltaproteobacteria bacterium]|jgi:fused signal recognition particle receptor|nr:signal recognition particle-docking protein FtsY [Deltaproteobacteria bacterium]